MAAANALTDSPVAGTVSAALPYRWSPMSVPPSRRAAALRRAAGHICARCQRPWALRASVETTEQEEGTFSAWVVRCRFCDYRRTVLTVRDGYAFAANFN